MAQLTAPRSRKMVIAMKAESTYGTDALGGTYTSADIIPCFDIAPDYRIEEIQNLSMAGDIGRLPSIMGIESGQVSFSMYVRGAGAAYSASVKPEAHKPLEACSQIGVLDATGGAEKYTYQAGTPASHTIWIVQENGRTMKMVGCHGSVESSGTAGNPLVDRFAFQGKINAFADVTFVPGTIVGTPGYLVLKAAAFQLGSGNYAPCIGSVGVALGNTVSGVSCINDATGRLGFIITDRNLRLSFDPLADTVAAFDWIASLRAGTLHDLSFQLGSVLYNKVKFQVGATLGSQAQVVGNTYGTRDGLTTYPTTILATISAGNDDFARIYS